jgi:hypothetical protein
MKRARQAGAQLDIGGICSKSAPVERERLPCLLRIVTLLPKLVGVIAERGGISCGNYRLGFFEDDGAAAGTANEQKYGEQKN